MCVKSTPLDKNHNFRRVWGWDVLHLALPLYVVKPLSPFVSLDEENGDDDDDGEEEEDEDDEEDDGPGLSAIYSENIEDDDDGEDFEEGEEEEDEDIEEEEEGKKATQSFPRA